MAYVHYVALTVAHPLLFFTLLIPHLITPSDARLLSYHKGANALPKYHIPKPKKIFMPVLLIM